MGLAGAKTRRKLPHDPRNTHWASNTSSFGHRQLLSQGWTPGSTLGATNSASAKHYTSASSGHIRTFLRQENLGLGAKVGKGVDECVGLGGLQDLLGRLNGKSEGVIEKEREARGDLKRKRWVENKYGGVGGGWVRGGWLVGDQMREQGEEEGKRREKKRKRRKQEEVDVNTGVDTGQAPIAEEAVTEPSKKEKKHKRRRLEARNELARDGEMKTAGKEDDNDVGGGQPAIAEKVATEFSKKTEKRKKRKEGMQNEQEDKPPIAEGEVTVPSKKKRKRRKEDLRNEQEDKLKPTVVAEKEATIVGQTITVSEITRNNTSTVSVAVTSSRPVTGNRYAVRQKHIAQKRRALMDPKALNEILMVRG